MENGSHPPGIDPPSTGRLARFLQQAFEREGARRGWACDVEAPLIDSDASRRLGFAPRVDVLLSRNGDSRRIWVEFEVSRADPVANQAKFASAAFFEGCGAGDAFVSMASRHIAPGRKALMATTAMFMRSVGIPAFQIDLLPDADGRTIRALNAATPMALEHAALDVGAEFDRVIAVADAKLVSGWHRIHMADNAFTVGANVRTWNAETTDPVLAPRWAKRRVRFLAFDPASQLFAPSKFCAFVPATTGAVEGRSFLSVREPPGGMTSAIYFGLGEQDPRFDGHIARVHLERRLRYRATPVASLSGAVARAFERWRARPVETISVPRDAVVLEPPV
ncbi:MAG: hypothetical protein RJA99_135 [Pseudomonadota bacterium]